MKKLPKIKKIAVLRANALGDFIFSLPALQSLRATYPQTEIVLLGKQWHKEFLENRPSPISRVVVVPPAPGVSEPNDFHPNADTLQRFFTQMQQEHFDMAIQMHGGGKYSNPFTKKLGARFTIGLQTQDAEPLDKTIPYVYYQNEYSRYLEVVSLLAVKPLHIIPHINVTSSDKKELPNKLHICKTPVVVLHPGANDLRRRWDTKKFAAVGDFLGEKNIQVIITGSLSEKFLIDDVIQTMRFPAQNLCGQLSLSELTGLLSKVNLVISNDTGLFHLAYSLGTPTIGLFWCGNMINGAPLTRDLTRPLISWVTHCPLCHQNCSSIYPFQPHVVCRHEVSFVNGISVNEVINAIDEMAARQEVHF